MQTFVGAAQTMAMNKDLQKICRVCMGDGSRNIFQKMPSTTAATPLEPEMVSSPDRLLEKLRYVALIKINDNDSLPALLCDLCIIQLNVAYNFKRKAVETDAKLRQFIIENGLSTTAQNSPIQPAIISSKSQAQTFQHRPFVSVPIQVKSEPIDYEIMSDITIETNTETEDGAPFHHHQHNYCPSTPMSNLMNDNPTPSPQSMVKLNDNHLLTATSSDSEFIKNCLRPPSTPLAYSPLELITLPFNGIQKHTSESSLIVANTKAAIKSDRQHSAEQRKTDDHNVESMKKKMKISIRKLRPAITRKIGNRELNGILCVDFNFQRKDTSNIEGTYPLRNKCDEQQQIRKSDNKQQSTNGHHKVLNPANRFRKQLKQEEADQNDCQFIDKVVNNNNVNDDAGSSKTTIKSAEHGNKLVNQLPSAATKKSITNQGRKQRKKMPNGINKKSISISKCDRFSLPTAAAVKSKYNQRRSRSSSSANPKIRRDCVAPL